MKNTILTTILLFVLWLPVLSQTTTKVFIIDTLESPEATFSITIVSPDSLDHDAHKNFDSIRSTHKNNTIHDTIHKKYPNFITTIYFLGNASDIQLQLDDSGGRMVIHDIFQITKDTIRICHYRVFHNCLPDTVKYWQGWYRKIPSDTVNGLRLLKQKHKPALGIGKDCVMKYPDSLTFDINAQKYAVALNSATKKDLACTWYHSHKKMGKRKERKWEYARAEGRPYVYFAASVVKQKYALFCEATLNK